jgi:PST family polysaccharide transporter
MASLDRDAPPPAPVEGAGGLGRRVMRAGLYLSGRSALSIVIGLVNLLLITRLIGPDGYGIYATALGLVLYLRGLASIGLDAWLVRREQEPSARLYGQALTLLVLSGGLVTVLGLALLVALGPWYRRRPR